MPAVPPFSKEKKLVLEICQCQPQRSNRAVGIYIREISQVLIRVQANPNVEMKRKFLCVDSVNN